MEVPRGEGTSLGMFGKANCHRLIVLRLGRIKMSSKLAKQPTIAPSRAAFYGTRRRQEYRGKCKVSTSNRGPEKRRRVSLSQVSQQSCTRLLKCLCTFTVQEAIQLNKDNLTIRTNWRGVRRKSATGTAVQNWWLAIRQRCRGQYRVIPGWAEKKTGTQLKAPLTLWAPKCSSPGAHRQFVIIKTEDRQTRA